MIYPTLLETAQKHPDRQFIVADDEEHTYDATLARVQDWAAQLEQIGKHRFLIYMRDSAELVCLMLAMDAIGGEISVLSRSATLSEIQVISQRLGINNLISEVEFESGALNVLHIDQFMDRPFQAASLQGPVNFGDEGSIIILTSGTTGIPKGAKYKWSRLLRQIQVRTRFDASRWGLTYHINHFAGIQVLLYVLCNRGTLVIPRSRDTQAVLDAIREHNIGYLSGTPTFWRMFTGILQNDDAREIHLKHITIGGEAVTDDLLERLQHLFPGVRISQMYVTTELGVCFTVRDNRKGFPLSYLTDSDLPVQLKIEKGELLIRSPHGMEDYVGGEGPSRDGWFSTGDLVRIEGDRVLFMGRKSETINVGGRKVHPHEVEEVILSIPGVQAVRVHGVENPITGQIVAAEVQLLPEYDHDSVEQNIRQACKSSLERYKQPRMFGFVDRLPTVNQKVRRRT